CVETCSSCKRRCTDTEKCPHDCAASCGTCKQECLKRRDHCATAECAERAQEGVKKKQQRWAANHCTGKCPAINACATACDQTEECLKKCRARFKGCDILYCIMGSPPEPSREYPTKPASDFEK